MMNVSKLMSLKDRRALITGANGHIGRVIALTLAELGADLILVEENPLENLKVLYGTGAIKLNDDNEIVRVGGVKYTISNGVVYDSKKLLKSVEDMVYKAKEKEGFTIKQPGN